MFSNSALWCRPSLSIRVVIILGLLLTACNTPSQGASTNEYRVLEVVDGDTLVIDFAGQKETVRLLGIDTPETVDPNRPVQCFGAEASEFLSALLPAGTIVTAVRDVEPRDRFGRLLVYLLRAEDGTFVNAELLRGGFGDLAIYDPNVAFRSELEHAFTTARTANAGLWQKCGGADVPIDPPPVSAPFE